jgi:hypothetical protein
MQNRGSIVGWLGWFILSAIVAHTWLQVKASDMVLVRIQWTHHAITNLLSTQPNSTV